MEQEIKRSRLLMNPSLTPAYQGVYTTERAWAGVDVALDPSAFGATVGTLARVLILGASDGVGEAIMGSGWVDRGNPGSGGAVWAAGARGIAQRWTVLVTLFGTPLAADIGVPVSVVASDHADPLPPWVGEIPLQQTLIAGAAALPFYGAGATSDTSIALLVTRIVLGAGGPDSIDVHDCATVAAAAAGNQVAQIASLGPAGGGVYHDPFAGYRFGSRPAGGLVMVPGAGINYQVFGR